jgi:hypothetical protein
VSLPAETRVELPELPLIKGKATKDTWYPDQASRIESQWRCQFVTNPRLPSYAPPQESSA